MQDLILETYTTKNVSKYNKPWNKGDILLREDGKVKATIIEKINRANYKIQIDNSGEILNIKGMDLDYWKLDERCKYVY